MDLISLAQSSLRCYTDTMSDHRFSLFDRAPGSVLLPGTISEVQEAVAASGSHAVIPWGGGTRQQLGYPPERYDIALSLENLDHVVDYQPDDLTVTVEAGISLSRVQSILAERNQRLPIEVPLPERATIGGAIATRADSLLRFSRGSVRDSLLGVTVVNHAGERVQGGGKVVKNVSGYDLPKLYCGSLGTLGVIVEATLRVVPLAESSATVLLPLPAGRNSEQALDTILTSELSPSLLYLIGAQAAPGIVPGSHLIADAQYLVVGFDGSAEAVSWQLKTLDASDGELEPENGTIVRGALRDYPADFGEISCSFRILSSQVGAFLRMVEWTAARSDFNARVVADAAVGIMWAHFTPKSESANFEQFSLELTDKASRCGGSFVVDKMPNSWRERAIPVWSPILPDINLMKRLKETLDPPRMWNPGRFIAGI